MTPEQQSALDELKCLKEAWDGDNHDLANTHLGLGTATPSSLKDACTGVQLPALMLYARLIALGLVTDGARGKQVDKDIKWVIRKMNVVCKNAFRVLGRRTADTDLDDDMRELLKSLDMVTVDRVQLEPEDMQLATRLALNMAHVAKENNYCKIGNIIYRPKIVNGVNMHSYEPLKNEGKPCTIRDFVLMEKYTGELYNHTMFSIRSNDASLSKVTDFLADTCSNLIPTIELDRTVFSFPNYVYFARTNTFLPHNEVPPGVAAISFRDQEFTGHLYHDKDWRDIPTPELDSIFLTQGMSRDVIEVFYVMAGRMIYALNDSKDNWQTMIFLYGKAGTGKSVLIEDVICQIFPSGFVRQAANDIEAQFGLSSLYDALIWYALEVDDKFNMDQAQFQSIITGEIVSVSIKGKTARDVVWTAPGIMAGNNFPGFMDAHGSIRRRMLVFHFPIDITSKLDSSKGKKIRNEFPSILYKLNRAYHEWAEKFDGRGLWAEGVLPDYFRETQKAMMRNTNGIFAFLESDAVLIGPDLFCPLDNFVSALTKFISGSVYKKIENVRDALVDPLQRIGARIERTLRTWHGETKRRDYIFGIDLAVFNHAPLAPL